MTSDKMKPKPKETDMTLQQAGEPRKDRWMKTRYTYKYPRTTWDGLREAVMKNKRLWWYSVEKAIEHIEESMRAGYTSEPWMQLIEITDSSMTVIAECEQGGVCDVDPLVAAGFKPRAIS
jgi:hypothetical protein